MLPIAAKQEAFEESIRLKNQFRSLDEDEIEFLDTVLESTRTKEAEIKKETTEQLDLFRRQQEEADRALLLAEAGDGNGTNAIVAGVDAAEEEQWTVSGKKRRRGKEKPGLKGVKLRKMSSASENKATQADERGAGPKPTLDDSPKDLGDVTNKQVLDDEKTSTVQPSHNDRSPKPGQGC